MKKIKIQPLSKDEMGHLIGGFATPSDPGISPNSLANGNCSQDSKIYNNNCACSKCSGGGRKDPEPPKDLPAD